MCGSCVFSCVFIHHSNRHPFDGCPLAVQAKKNVRSALQKNCHHSRMKTDDDRGNQQQSKRSFLLQLVLITSLLQTKRSADTFAHNT